MEKRLDNNHLIILIAIILFAGYIRTTNLTQPIWPDEALYAKTAENLYMGKGLTFDGTPWRHQPPFFILLIVLSYFTLGVSEISARIVGSLFGILGIIAVYYLGKYLYNEKVGIIAAFFLGATPVHWFLSRMILADIVLTTLITLTILLFYISTERDSRYTLVTSILIALVCLTKYVGPIIYIILISYLIVSERNLDWIKRKELQTIFSVSVILQMPLYIIKFDTLNRFSAIYSNYIHQFSTPNPQGLIEVFKVLPYTLSKPVLLFVPMGIFFMIRLMKKEDILIISPILIFLFVFVFWGATWMEAPRYLIPSVPFFCIISAYGIHNFSERIEKKSVYIFFMIILVFFTAAVNADQGTEMVQVEWGRYSGYENVSRWIDHNTSKDTIIVTDSRIIRYYSNRNFIYYDPEEASFQKSIEDTPQDIYLMIDTQNRISPHYIVDYIGEHQDMVHKMATFNIGHRTNVEIYILKKSHKSSNDN